MTNLTEQCDAFPLETRNICMAKGSHGEVPHCARGCIVKVRR
jgi:hypothetical protein